MPHAIIDLQTQLIAALLADVPLQTALGSNAIFDAPPRGIRPPYIAILRHDVLPRDGDDAPGYDHRLVLQCRLNSPSRSGVLALVERIVSVAIQADLSTSNRLVTHARHDRTETTIDTGKGQARALVSLRFYTEPAA